MSKTATPTGIKPREFRGWATHYKLSEPFNGHDYVIVSAIDNKYGAETYIFPADDEGNATDWEELPGSFKGACDHAEALNGAGYEVAA